MLALPTDRRDEGEALYKSRKDKKKKKSTLRKKKRDITNTRKRHPFLFPLHNRIRTQLTDKSVLLTTILQAE